MNARLQFTDLHPQPADMRAEVAAGLSRPRKQIPPKYFYDRQGSRLFNAITELPEYYPTRTEIGILQRHGAEMAKLVGSDALLGGLRQRQLLERIGGLLGRGGSLLIGVDLIKDVAVLNAAYNDAHGITAEFNINLLRRINRELGANFDLEGFMHRAFFNARESRIEMHLVSKTDQRFTLAGAEMRFRAGETIHTESSYKYSVEGFPALARDAGFQAERVWTDADDLFSVHCLRFSQSP